MLLGSRVGQVLDTESSESEFWPCTVVQSLHPSEAMSMSVNGVHTVGHRGSNEIKTNLTDALLIN